jgi:response regulator RpfG family c-di-GMP phosphodiesterase
LARWTRTAHHEASHGGESEQPLNEPEVASQNEGDALSKLSALAEHRSSDLLDEVLGAARQQLGMEVAFVSEYAEGKTVFRSLDGDAESFGFREGVGTPLESSFCRRVIEGRIPSVVADAAEDEEVRDLGVKRAADIGSYVGVPLQLSDGRLYGTICCMSHSPAPELRERDAEFMNVLARFVAEHIEREEAESEKRRLAVRATGAGALLAALDARDGYTGEHSKAVVDLSVKVARRLGLSEEEVADIEQVALLHDVGKIGVADSVLNKPGPLDEGDWEEMRRHPVIGERIVASTYGMAHLAPAIRAEHERWDGKGYPDGLRGEEIPIASRIVFACDAFHVMTSDRPYRASIGTRAAIEELERNAGTQFCPHVIPALLDIIDQARIVT